MQTPTMRKSSTSTSTPGRFFQRCAVCSSPPRSDLSDSILENENTLKKAVQKIFQYLLVSYKSFRDISDDSCMVFCATCIKSVEEIAVIQRKVDNLELRIQHKVETLGRLVCTST